MLTFGCGRLKEKHGIKFAENGLDEASITINPSAFPKTAAELVKARVGILPAVVQRMLLTAASGGEVFDGQYVLEAGQGLDAYDGSAFQAKQVPYGLKMCGEIGMLHALGNKTDNVLLERWTFKHNVLFRAVLSLLDSGKRAAIEKRCVEAKAALHKRLTAVVLT
jgi:hypothetical protein